MIHPHEVAMRHGEKSDRGKLTDDGKETVDTSIEELAERFKGLSQVAIHASPAAWTLETAERVANGLKQKRRKLDVTVDVTALLNPRLSKDPSREALLDHFKQVRNRQIKELGRRASGLLVVGHMSNIVELANLDRHAAPDYGEIFPIEWLTDVTEDEPDEELPTRLNLGTGDREMIEQTEGATALARELLQRAQDEAKDLRSGSEVIIKLTSEHLQVHHLELMLVFTILGAEYGLRVISQHDNTQIFEKI